MAKNQKNWRNFTDEEMLDMLKNEITRLNLEEWPSRTKFQNSFDKNNSPSPTVLMNRLKLSWKELMEKLDLNYDVELVKAKKKKSKRNGKWQSASDEEIREAVVNEFNRLGSNKAKEYIQKRDRKNSPSNVWLIEKYGGWDVISGWWNEELKYKRGDIVFANLGQGVGDEKQGLRPVVILSNDILNSSSKNVLIAPLTNSENKMDESKTINLLPWQSYLSNKHYKGLKKSSVVQLEDMRSISKQRLEDKVIDHLSNSSMKDVEKKLSVLFSFDQK